MMFIAARATRAADPWPGTLPGTEIGQGLPAGCEPSGGAWHRRLDKFLTVCDSGVVAMMNPDGTGVATWSVPGDLEGIAVAEPAGNFIYIGVEQPDSIREFNIATGQVTRTFDLTPWLQGPDNAGLEALEFIPDALHPEGGLFYAGLQQDGKIYKFSLPIRSSATSTTVTFVGTITPVAGRTDISGLDYDRENQILYAVFDASNTLRAMRANGAFEGEWLLPANDQEGIAIRGCELFVADDSGKVFRYGFPADRRDEDADGVTNCADLCPGTPVGTLVGPTGCSLLPTCVTNADCSDGIYCNGAEICNQVIGCRPGAAPACPGQWCSETLDQCVQCRMDVECATSQICNVPSGQCVSPPAPPLPVRLGDTWRYFKGVAEPPPGWNTLAYNDAAWTAGPGGFGYGADCAGMHLTVLGDMQNSYMSVYTRHVFSVHAPATVTSLTLTMDFDDGFVAWLNGVMIARRNVDGVPPTHAQPATGNRECSVSAEGGNPAESYPISPLLLRDGTNVIAVQGHNLSLGSSDFSLIPSVEYRRSVGTGTDSLWASKLGSNLFFFWNDVPGVEGYVVRESSTPGGSFATIVGTAATGAEGITIPVPSDNRFYLLAPL